MTRSTRVSRCQTLAQSRLFTLETVDVAFWNGAHRRFERVRGSGRGGVLIVPVLDDGTVLLIREYAAGTERYELGLPKGRLEGAEDVLEAANRELMEEVGYGARQLVPLRRLSLAPTYLSHVTQVVLATDLYPESRPGDEPEPMEVVSWPLRDVPGLLAAEDITEARSLAALYMARDHLLGTGTPPD